MSRIISEILKITIDSRFQLSSPAFAELRRAAVRAGVQEQYYGLVQNKPNLLSWVIQWPEIVKDPASYKGEDPSTYNFRDAIAALDVNQTPTSWYLPFESADIVRPALVAPVTEYATVILKPDVDRTLPEVAKPLHKTFIDCYDAPGGGFTGGYWSPEARDDRLNVYVLGWESRKLHAEFSKTELFALELNNLMPYMAGGEGIFVELTQEKSNL